MIPFFLKQGTLSLFQTIVYDLSDHQKKSARPHETFVPRGL